MEEAKEASALACKLDSHLQKQHVYDGIRSVLQGFLQRSDPTGGFQEKELIQQLITRMDAVPESLSKVPDTSSRIRYLHVRLNPGKAFLDCMVDQSEPSNPLSPVASTVFISLNFRGKQVRSHPVASVVDPEFDEEWLFPLQDPDRVTMAPIPSLLLISEKIEVAIYRETQMRARKPVTAEAWGTEKKVELLGTHKLEWRRVLVHGKEAITFEVKGENDIPVGLLDFELSVLPLKYPKSNQVPIFVEEGAVAQHLQKERLRDLSIDARFRAYAKAWWQDYASIRPQHQDRLIKLFAAAEDGGKYFVSTFVQPLRGNRCLDSALHAFRLVRLIPFTPNLDLGGTRTECWNNPQVICNKRCGDLEDHVTLLCSLLLGFGLDAWCCVGTNVTGGHMWVMTRNGDGSLTFWEALTGIRHHVPKKTSTSSFPVIPQKAIHCIFNHKAFYANNQEDDSLQVCNWRLTDARLWKEMNQEAIAALPRLSNIGSKRLSLQPPTLKLASITDYVEDRIKQLISSYRKTHHQVSQTQYDDDFAYIIGPSLSSYECERVSGTPVGNKEFEEAVKRAISREQAFKGVPLQFLSTDPGRIFERLMQNAQARDLLSTRGDSVKFSVAVKVFSYPEDFTVTWVMLGVRYIDVSTGK